ncbi:hypothetical protein O6P43_016124 [Quillaja saponaria]|uniref:Uncharacterized protein n=1 Tax=Quillaja saponaria TaxID=32244 RepID=A0AAD7LYS6_QUISA|nr:hypothetical protein O6P43_016124 [Quillaja saponaria]
MLWSCFRTNVPSRASMDGIPLSVHLLLCAHTCLSAFVMKVYRTILPFRAQCVANFSCLPLIVHPFAVFLVGSFHVKLGVVLMSCTVFLVQNLPEALVVKAVGEAACQWVQNLLDGLVNRA